MADEPRLYRPRPRDLPTHDEHSLIAALNPDQARAVTFGDSPLLVIAGAGTGKTRTLVHRVAFLIERGVAPERIITATEARLPAASDTADINAATITPSASRALFHAL